MEAAGRNQGRRGGGRRHRAATAGGEAGGGIEQRRRLEEVEAEAVVLREEVRVTAPREEAEAATVLREGAPSSGRSAEQRRSPPWASRGGMRC